MKIWKGTFLISFILNIFVMMMALFGVVQSGLASHEIDFRSILCMRFSKSVLLTDIEENYHDILEIINKFCL